MLLGACPRSHCQCLVASPTSGPGSVAVGAGLERAGYVEQALAQFKDAAPSVFSALPAALQAYFPAAPLPAVEAAAESASEAVVNAATKADKSSSSRKIGTAIVLCGLAAAAFRYKKGLRRAALEVRAAMAPAVWPAPLVVAWVCLALAQVLTALSDFALSSSRKPPASASRARRWRKAWTLRAPSCQARCCVALQRILHVSC